MRQFARRNAGVAAALCVYGALGAGGILVVRQAMHPMSPPTAILPASPAPSPSQSPSTRPVVPSPTPTVDVSRTLVAADPGRRDTAAGAGRPSGGGGPGGGSGAKPTPRPTHQPPQLPQPPESPRCPAGRIVAVSDPLGVLPCDTVRVGGAVTIGGTRK